jgi:hypothetical protein
MPIGLRMSLTSCFGRRQNDGMRIALALILVLLNPSVHFGADNRATDLATANTTWKGIEAPDDRNAKAKDRPATLKILERNGDDFVAEYWVQAQRERRGVKLKGEIHRGKISAKAVEVLKGVNWEEGILECEWAGGVKGEELVLQRKHQDLITTTKLTIQTESSKPSR